MVVQNIDTRCIHPGTVPSDHRESLLEQANAYILDFSLDMSSEWTVAAAGDAIIGTGIAVHDRPADPGFFEMCQVIRQADVSSANLETSAFDLDTFAGWPSAERGGSYLLGPPRLLDDLAAIGFDFFARANNHAGDWGIEGLIATTRELEARGMAHAGVGMNLAEAARPVYRDTDKGRVAMLSHTTTFPVSSKAAHQRSDMRGRPGCNGISVRRQIGLPRSSRQTVEAALGSIDNPRLLAKAGLEVVEADEPSVTETLFAPDVDRVLSEIEKAAAFADLVLVNGHTHEPRNEVIESPSWLTDLARRCIDAGAHAYLGHGPHQLRPVEIYSYRPIFHSLGNFVFHREVSDPIPAEQYELFDLDPLGSTPQDYLRARDGDSGHELKMTGSRFYESMIPMMAFKSGRLDSMTLHPIELSIDSPIGARGTPRLADEALGEKILSRLLEMSAPHGTDLRIHQGRGHWKNQT